MSCAFNSAACVSAPFTARSLSPTFSRSAFVSWIILFVVIVESVASLGVSAIILIAAIFAVISKRDIAVRDLCRKARGW